MTIWTGTINTDWFTAGNWHQGVPTASLNATIPASTLFQPWISAGGAAIRNLGISSGASLTMSGSTLDVRGDWGNNGTFTATSDTGVLGTSVPTTLFGANRSCFYNLTVQANGAQLSTSAGLAGAKCSP